MVSVITGASGFIGKHLSARLQELGHQVLELPRDWKKVPECDWIFHLAAYGNKYDQTDEKEIFKTNVLLLWKLLAKTKRMKYKAFINFSTSGHILGCNSFYGATKACGENIVKAFVHKYGKPIVNIRPFSVYGPDDDPKHFIPTAVKAFKENSELKLAHGDHDWIHVSDLVSGVIKAAENADQLKGQAIDVGTGIAQSNYAVVSILKDIFQKSGKITRVDKMRSYDTENWSADNSVLKKLGWEPKIDLEGGLERLVYE